MSLSNRLVMAGFQYHYQCPHCGTYLELRKRVTVTVRTCPQCGAPITPDEIDRQEDERQKQEAEQKRLLLMQELMTFDEIERRRKAEVQEQDRREARRHWRSIFGNLSCVGCLVLLPLVAGGAFLVFLIVMVVVAPRPETARQASSAPPAGKEPKQDAKEVQAPDKLAEQK